MRDWQLHIGLWWGRFRLRWRRRLRTLEAWHALDAFVAVGLAIAGLLTAASKAEDSTKISLGVLFGVTGIVYVFARFIIHRLNAMAERSLSILPDQLPRTIYYHLDGEREKLLSRARELAANASCDLEKHEMYATLIHLTDTVTEQLSGTLSAAIYAISGTDIEDFEREVLAQAYLEANTRAASGLVVVRRLFLLDFNHLHSARIRAIMQKHEAAIATSRHADSGVKWLPKTEAGSDRDLDLALFANEALVRQVSRPGGAKGELTVNDLQIEPALEAFRRLWDHSLARPVADFHPLRR